MIRYKYSKVFSLLLLLVPIIIGSELDFQLSPQSSFYSAAVKSLGDAGIAYPLDITSGLINPSLVFSHFQKDKRINGEVSIGYARDTLFDKNIIPAGIGYNSGDGALAVFFRRLADKDGRTQSEFVLNMSGMLFGASMNNNEEVEAGQVNIGINTRYEVFSWKKRIIGSSGLLQELTNAHIDQKRLIWDLGLYQSEIARNLDFALTIRNLFGYTWSKETPVLKDTLIIDSIVRSVPYYDQGTQKNKGWLKKEYRIFTTGIVYHADFGGGVYRIGLPIDIEILGLFDKHVKNQYVFRGGVATVIQDRFCFRLGYSRTPGPIQSGLAEIKKVNVFTGGAGVIMNTVKIDFYLTDDAFGTTFALGL